MQLIEIPASSPLQKRCCCLHFYMCLVKPPKKIIERFLCLVALMGMSSPLLSSTETDLGTTGWTLWLDRTAQWQNDTLYLPPAVISSLPVNPPTGGWSQLFANVLPESQATQAVGTSSANSKYSDHKAEGAGNR